LEVPNSGLISKLKVPSALSKIKSVPVLAENIDPKPQMKSQFEKILTENVGLQE